MRTVDNYTKVMLTLLVIGVWGLLLRPMISATPAEAQQPTPAISPAPQGAIHSGTVIKAAQVNADQLTAQHSYVEQIKSSNIAVGTLDTTGQQFKTTVLIDGSKGVVNATTDNVTTTNAATGNLGTANINAGNVTTANITTGNVALLHARVIYFDDVNKTHRPAIFLDAKGNLLIRKYNSDNKPIGADRVL